MRRPSPSRTGSRSTPSGAYRLSPRSRSPTRSQRSTTTSDHRLLQRRRKTRTIASIRASGLNQIQVGDRSCSSHPPVAVNVHAGLAPHANRCLGTPLGADVLARASQRSSPMARKYSKSASKDVERAMHKEKRGQLKSGRSGKTVKSRKQASPSACPKPARRARRCRRKGELGAHVPSTS